jgi:hypothetical protein
VELREVLSKSVGWQFIPVELREALSQSIGWQFIPVEVREVSYGQEAPLNPHQTPKSRGRWCY